MQIEGGHCVVSLPSQALATLEAAARSLLTTRLTVVPSTRPGTLLQVDAAVGPIHVAGVTVERLVVRASEVRFRPGLRPSLTVGRAAVRASVGQVGVDQWVRATGAPLRVVLRSGFVQARTGLAGRRLAHVDVTVALAEDRIRLVPRRTSLLGIELPGASLAPTLNLPLPALPRGARLVALRPLDGVVDVDLEVMQLEEPLHLSMIWRALVAVAVPTVSRDRRHRSAPARPTPRAQPSRA